MAQPPDSFGALDAIERPRTSFPPLSPPILETSGRTVETPVSARRRTHTLRFLLAAFGPGIMVMLADTDAGSIVTASQSGAQWGYRMIPPLIALVAVLYLVQEMTVRLGIVTGKGHGELIRERFGTGWACLSVGTLFLAAMGALVTEFAAISGVGQLFGVPPLVAVGMAVGTLIVLGLTSSYGRVERVGIAVGLFELFFIPAALMAHPDAGTVGKQLLTTPFTDRDYLFLLAANVGAVIMPWMVFYQQGAVIDKRLGVRHLKGARLDTLLGSVMTQVIMIAVVVATAATIGLSGGHRSLNSIQEIATALQPFLGWTGARLVFGLGMLGAAFVAALVVSVASAWAVGEALGTPHSLNHRVAEARWFYLAYVLALAGGAAVVLSGIPLVSLTINIEVMNALLLPLVLGFLLALEAKALPPDLRMRGLRKYVTWLSSSAVMAFGVFMAARLLLGG